jgi:hypothetical protein
MQQTKEPPVHNRCLPRERLVGCTIGFRELRLGERCDPVWEERHSQAEGEIQCGVYDRAERVLIRQDAVRDGIEVTTISHKV